MLQNESSLLIVDNSGAIKLLIIRCLGGSNRRYSRIGDIVIGTIKKVYPNSNVKKGDIVSAIVVSSRAPFFRSKGRGIVSFSKNCAVLIDRKTKNPIGTRIFSPLLYEFNEWGYKNLFSLASEIL